MGKRTSIDDVETISNNTLRALVPRGQRYNVRTFFEEDIEIPIYEIPLPQKVRVP